MENKCAGAGVLFFGVTIRLPSSASASALLCSMGWGGYPFAEKSRHHFLPPKIPAIFSKIPLPPNTFNTTLTYI